MDAREDGEMGVGAWSLETRSWGRTRYFNEVVLRPFYGNINLEASCAVLDQIVLNR